MKKKTSYCIATNDHPLTTIPLNKKKPIRVKLERATAQLQIISIFFVMCPYHFSFSRTCNLSVPKYSNRYSRRSRSILLAIKQREKKYQINFSIGIIKIKQKL